MAAEVSVSIIVNNYNYAHFLADAVDSALRQTYRAIEVLVVDDGSTDESRTVLARYGTQIQTLYKANGGQASAFNAGFAQSRGQIVFFLDADDMLLPDTVQRVVAAFVADQTLAKVQYRLAVVDAHGRATGATDPPAHLPLPQGDLRRRVLRFPDDVSYPPTSGNAFAAWVLRRIFPIPERVYGRVLADVYLYNLVPLFGSVHSLEGPGGLYRAHGGNHHYGAHLDLDQVRQIINYSCVTHLYIKQYADALGLTGFPADPARVRAVTFLAHRLTSLKLVPAQHPLPADRAWSLVRDGLAASLGRFDLSWAMRGLYMVWFIAAGPAPAPVVRWLATQFFYPEQRGRLGALLSVGQWPLARLRRVGPAKQMPVRDPDPASAGPEAIARVPDVAIHPLLEVVFRDFAGAGIRWCVLRDEDELGRPARERDVDLLMARADGPRARMILTARGFLTLTTRGRGSHRFFLAYHSASECWIRLDVVTALAYGPQYEFHTNAAHAVLARRWDAGALACPAPDDAFWTLLLHCVLDKQEITPARKARLQELGAAARTDSALARLVDLARPAGVTAEALRDSVQQGQWAAVLAAGPRLAAAWTSGHPAQVRARAWANRLARPLEKPLAVLHAPSLSVALLGPDGAGKSTIAAGIARVFYFPTRLVYMGMWQNHTPRTGGVPGLDLVQRLGKVWAGYLLARYHQARGRLVVFDRYTYDALLPAETPLDWRGRLYFWVLGHACPRPDLALVLDAPGTVMYARKGEYNPAHLEAERQEFRALRHRVRGVEIVDATRGPDAVRADVVARIWRRYRAQGRA